MIEALSKDGAFLGRSHFEVSIYNDEDTIVAISTPVGSGGIGVIRISGSDTLNILDKIFRPKSVQKILKSWQAYLGNIYDEDVIIDEVIVTIFKGPRSYTSEDMIEISCHGGIYIARRILDIVLKTGARLAEPGEFTKRAFLNGRIDLSQAEAVAELIQSKTELSLQVSLKQLEGKLHSKIKSIQDELIDAVSLLEIELDFSEEDLEFVNRDDFIEKLRMIMKEIDELIHSYQKGKIIKEGINLIIIGKPNVGKSSLLNALLKEDRAIVTDIPGTTRDVLEEQLDIKGILFKVIDTAGITETEDPIEMEGVYRTRRQIQRADAIIHVMDYSNPINKNDQRIINEIQTLSQNRKHLKIIVVLNKIDLEKKIKVESIPYSHLNIPIVKTSAPNMQGIDILEDILYKQAVENSDSYQFDELIITKVRHLEALKKCNESLKNASDTLRNSMSSEFISLDLRDALDALGEIIGTVTSEDILNNIFKKFCIGK